MTDKNQQDSIENAEEIIERFGGIRPMANKMDVPVTTVQGWKKRNVIPANRRKQVIEAAEKNDIDLSGLVAGAANENDDISDNSAFDLEMSAAYDEQDAQKEEQHQQAVIAAKRSHDSASIQSGNEELMKQIRQAQSTAFNKSAAFSVVLVALVIGVSVLLLWPSKQQIEQNGKTITRLQGDVAGIKESQSFLHGLIPDNLKERFSKIQEQTTGLQTQVEQLSAQAETIAHDVLDPQADMGTRIARLGAHVEQIAGPNQLTDMLHKVRELQQSAEGQQQLADAIAELNMLVQSMQGQEGELEEALQQAQKEDDALGQTLQGVAQEDLKAATLLLGLAQIRSSLNRNNTPFEEDLALLQKMLGEDDPELQAAITRLAPKAENGVLTPEGLKGEFKGLAGDIVVSSLKGEDVSVKEKARARMNNLIQVEKDGELLTGTDTQATVMRAQKMLDEGDIEGAIAELQSLDGEAAQTAQPFIDEAQVTLIAEQLQKMLTGKVLQRVGGSMDVTAHSGGMGRLIGEIKKMAPQRHVITEPESGFSILEAKPDYMP